MLENIDRDAKIIVIYQSFLGIAFFASFAITIMHSQRTYPDKDFTNVLILIFGIITILSLLLIASIISLKREISRQKEYLLNLPQQPSQNKEQYAKVPYDKSGLYFLIGVSALLIILVLFLFTGIVFNQQSNAYVPASTFITVSTIFVVILIILFVTLFLSIHTLLKRIHTPVYYEVKACPRCNSTDVFMNDYSWWGGFVGPRLVHQVRCKKCGKAYNGATGTDITRHITIYMIIGFVILFVLMILNIFF